MSHIAMEQWLRYVNGELPPEERERCETHLAVCDDCLELYMRCLEQAGERLPGLADEAAFADEVMERFNERVMEPDRLRSVIEDESIGKKWRFPIYQHPFFHYAVAAVITLILMSSGVFHTITEQIPSIESMPANAEDAEPSESFSKKLLDEAIVMLDSIQPKRERGSHP